MYIGGHLLTGIRTQMTPLQIAYVLIALSYLIAVLALYSSH